MLSSISRRSLRQWNLPGSLAVYSKPASLSTKTSTQEKLKLKEIVEDDAASEPEPLSYLKRPLGVKERPTTYLKSWTEKRNELMDQDKRLAQRKHLVKEASKGYFHDLNRTRHHGGKTWIAPNVLIREDKALYFPNIVGTTLDAGSKAHTTDLFKDRISVVGILSTAISQHQVAHCVEPVNSLFIPTNSTSPTMSSPTSPTPSSHPLYQHILINHQPNLLKSFLVSLFLSSIRRTIPAYLHPTYLLSTYNLEYVREEMGMVNDRVGYVYLVDGQGRIRWAACADAKEEERKALVNCVRVLLERTEGNMRGVKDEGRKAGGASAD
ncbi:hypothetical protein JAAARDRAFT_34530 [Jaapia argillacea MUCL 33604]|uniref:ATP10 protein n=1 Tax=Jaapia argillacea MUCL 33604 TaxID=933084 RepID=A0A067Q5C5_9AGAM|nr:hypothetical protein JAAARDRAFT_34530 [Jaapia argillacea MUCL 33604]